MGKHNVVVMHREVDAVTGALDYRASCEPCRWAGEWRVSEDTAVHDGGRHCRYEDRTTRLIERDGRKLRAYAYGRCLWLQDVCDSCGQPITHGKHTSVIWGRNARRAGARLERAVRRRLSRTRPPCGACNESGHKFDINDVLTGGTA